MIDAVQPSLIIFQYQVASIISKYHFYNMYSSLLTKYFDLYSQFVDIKFSLNVVQNGIRVQNGLATISYNVFLAHLSQRLVGELIV